MDGHGYTSLCERVEKLERENLLARRCLAFYANVRNWDCYHQGFPKDCVIIDPLDQEELTDNWGDTYIKGGKIARDWFKKTGEQE